jgi:non-specific serine/threonine protein kinase
MDVLDLLSRLIEKSLVVKEERGKEVRFRMLETIRQYASHQFYASEEVGDTRQRHLAYYLDFAKIEKKVRTEQRLKGLEQFENELDNLRRALYWALVENPMENAEAGLRLASALREFWYVYGLFNEGREWIKECLELVKAGEEISEHPLARAYYAIGYLEYHWGDITEARRAFEKSAPLYRKLGDERGLMYWRCCRILYISGCDAAASQAIMDER